MIKDFANKWISGEYKFKYLIFSIISGILLALSFQKFNFFLLAWIALVPLIYCVYRNGFKYSLFYGFVAGLVYSTVSTSWMLPFLIKNTNLYADSIIVAISAWLYLAFYFVIWSVLLNYIIKFFNNKIIIVVFASAFWVILELIKTYVLTGLPWNLLGYSQATFVWIIQIADITGIYGISFAVILINMLLFYWIYDKNRKYLFYSVLIILSLSVYGFIRIEQFPTNYGNKNISVAIIQPNIPQYIKWDDKNKQKISDKLFLCARQFESANIDIMLYPETVLPGRLLLDKPMKKLVEDISKFAKITLIGGKYHKSLKVYNSIFIVNSDGEITDKYRKKHLVLFGEYVPFKSILSKFSMALNVDGSMHNEDNINVFRFDDYILGINICSENFYPYLSRELTLRGANVLTNHTNDAWFDGTFEPYQHFAMNIFRAVENRKYLLVSANTGISGIISPSGKVIKDTKNMEQLCFTGEAYTNNYITTYDKIGDSFAYICLSFVIIVLFFPVFGPVSKR